MGPSLSPAVEARPPLNHSAPRRGRERPWSPRTAPHRMHRWEEVTMYKVRVGTCYLYYNDGFVSNGYAYFWYKCNSYRHIFSYTLLYFSQPFRYIITFHLSVFLDRIQIWSFQIQREIYGSPQHNHYSEVVKENTARVCVSISFFHWLYISFFCRNGLLITAMGGKGPR